MARPHGQGFRLDRLLSTTGYCSRSRTRSFLHKNKVTLDGQRLTNFDAAVRIADPKAIRINGDVIDFLPPISIVMHKPVDYICTRLREQKDSKIIFDLLPPRMLKLTNPVLSIAGRLDKPVSGLVILTQQGKLLHRIIRTNQMKTVHPKVYELTTHLPFTGREKEEFESGSITLRNEETACRPAQFQILDAKKHLARITLYEGRYHQLTRMLAALGNTAKTIHRLSIGSITLGDLPPGGWRHLTDEEIRDLSYVEL